MSLPFKKVLVANRGEVALRIIRACRELSVPSALVYSEADRDSLPVRVADEAVCIGPAPAQDSYLNVSRILSAAEITKSDALHPGYGFLSESPEFAEAAESCKVTFIGPTAETLRLAQDKIRMRQIARQANLAVVPGSDGEVNSSTDAAGIAAELGYPILVKAAAGRGGGGMRLVKRDRDIETGFRMCQAEAKAAFGDGRVYIEKHLANARHVEVQLLADRRGNVSYLPERDCSVQFRYRKLLEESPSPAVSGALRRVLGKQALAIGRAVGLTNSGTVEFLMDDRENCFFLEINGRLQIEHGVTEMVTGLDIVQNQLFSAAGEPLILPAEDPAPLGHAIECRITAEDAEVGFEPSSGLVTDARMAGGPGIRVDSYLSPGYVVPPLYEPLVAKLIAWAPDRPQAIARMARALAETAVTGITTTVGLHRRLMESGRFRRGKLGIGMLDEELAA
ncbi:acetyl-CoA carboxylase biotin carboxylase subunit [candidate division WOR-3 bacterium]|uniref:biotin carboxylase n=1 Tax=candidate division WOR-3 bacterium TaxID=2052148 RepID=A0A937XGF6_UNCW3|nr:acetyl-CoA carboxylase biotin carboxylase subunit [candidate division WOR-3 bacterium]